MKTQCFQGFIFIVPQKGDVYMAKKKSKGNVMWILPGKKRPFAYSTTATSDLIVALAQEYDTVRQVHDAINFDHQAKAILQYFIDAGYGTSILRKMVK